MHPIVDRCTAARPIAETRAFAWDSVKKRLALSQAIVPALACGVLGLCGQAAHADVMNVSFPNFSSTNGLTLNGNATPTTTSDGTVLRLVDDHNSEHGGMFGTTKVNAHDFSTFFQFRITWTSWTPADGFAFVLQNQSVSVGDGGGGLGYENVGDSVAVEFDTFQNPEHNDPGYSTSYCNSYCASYVDVLENGSLDHHQPTNTPGYMPNGDLWSAWIDYNGSTLEVRLADGSAVRPTDALLSYDLDIPTIIGEDDAWVGFTSATGAASENTDIVDWNYSAEYVPGGVGQPPASAVPEPGSLVLLGAGLLGLCVPARRKLS